MPKLSLKQRQEAAERLQQRMQLVNVLSKAYYGFQPSPEISPGDRVHAAITFVALMMHERSRVVNRIEGSVLPEDKLDVLCAFFKHELELVNAAHADSDAKERMH